jgi:tRNA(adenine34) deaminase
VIVREQQVRVLYFDGRIRIVYNNNSIMTLQDYMQLAIVQAGLAQASDEVPVGALIVSPDEKILSKAFNQCIALNDPTAHAEIIAIRAACKLINNYRLNGCTLITTLEPCLMCASAISAARISRVVFGAHDSIRGACGSVIDVNFDTPSNHRFEVIGGVGSETCKVILDNFFSEKR